ncbi:TlpA disulfide reductase family protein [Nocardioides sp.]|uniref:TlpA disulfide reductase family protein n=1 Tax=Nocardioides sp. TaxID=35761 RepID=UPI003D0D83D7
MQYDATDRGDPIDLTGETLEGESFDVADLRGKVVVVNVWWSACAPCRLEAPMLVGAAAQTAADADFVGVNIRDNSAEPALAFDTTFGVTYPSIYDPTGKALLAFAGKVNLQAVPTTVVLDREGRIAATISGAIPSQLTLTDVIDDVAGQDG